MEDDCGKEKQLQCRMSLLLALFAVFAAPAAATDCRKAVMYFFDVPRQECFPILTDTCSAEAKERFDDLGSCQRQSLPMDRILCAANTPPMKRANGDSHCFAEGMPEAASAKCPEGAVCLMGFRVGVCCSKAIEEEHRANREAKCDIGKQALKITGDEFGRKFFGKECSHNFCPEGSTCKQGKYLAYCCK